MRSRSTIVVIAIGCLAWSELLAAAEAPGGAGLTMNDVFAAALHRADTVIIDLELIKQAEENYRQALGAMLPNLVGTGSLTQQQQVSNGIGTSISPSYQPIIKLTATQPLFVGLKDFAGLRQTDDLIGATKLDRDGAVVQLYKDTLTTFFTIVQSEKDLANVIVELQYYDQRIAELQRFKKIGRSQLTDVLTAQVAQETLRATEKQLRGQIEASRQMLTVITGLDVHIPLAATVRDELPALESLPDYLEHVDDRPEIRASLLRSEASGEGITIARAGHLPSVQLSGDYYLRRYGPSKDVTWDVTLGVTMPIYSGGIVVSQVDQASSVKRQADDSVTQARHSAEQEIRSDYATLLGDKAQLDALKFATDLAKRNYEAETHDYRLGLVTNLDVLTALTSFQEDQRALDRQRYTMLMDYEKLEAAVARRPLGFMLSVAVGPKAQSKERQAR